MCKNILPSALLLLSCCLQVNCSGITESAMAPDLDAFSIQTVQTEYMVEENLPLTVTYELVNDSKSTIYYPNDGNGHFWRLEKRLDEKWILAYDPVFLDILRPPYRINPKERIAATMRIDRDIWNAALRLPHRTIAPAWNGGDIEGTYRVGVTVFTSWSQEQHEDGAPTEIVFSNPFEVRRAQ